MTLRAHVNSTFTERDRLLFDFHVNLRKARPLLVARFGKTATVEIIDETRREFEALIPRIPDVGDKEPFTRFLISTAQYLVLYRAMQNHGLSLEEAGQLLYTITDRIYSNYPRFLLLFLSDSVFSDKIIQKVREGAEESQRQEYPGDYVFSFVEGDGVDFDYGVDYTECGACKFLEAEGALELAPYVCASDVIFSDKLGWGLRRTMTIAEGYSKCDFRFKKGGKTSVTSSVLHKKLSQVIEHGEGTVGTQPMTQITDKAMTTLQNTQV